MNIDLDPCRLKVLSAVFVLFSAQAGLSVQAQTPPTQPLPCPTGLGWSEGLSAYFNASTQMPTDDTQKGATDCAFHQWSWEAFVWATALDSSGVPRFMKFPTPADLLDSNYSASKPRASSLRLGARTSTSVNYEGAGAIVEADGNMLVAPNGYPVYASVHMNPSYFDTARKNMIKDGGYEQNAPDPKKKKQSGDENYFQLGAAVFKATWLRLDDQVKAPAGAFVTTAEVPRLMVLRTKNTATMVPNGVFEKVKVALVGLHVVGYTVNHPEFLWATFEHNANAPRVPDNTFSTTGSDSKDYTFYNANTSYADVNIQNSDPATLTYDFNTGKFTPVTQVVLQNKTGGETNPGGPQNIEALNQSAQAFLNSQTDPNKKAFGAYNLIGTVWFNAGTFTADSDQTNAVGSVNLANSTAETFVQAASFTSQKNVQNCFMCHNGQSYISSGYPPSLPKRRIAISHVLAEGTPYAVANAMPVKVPGHQ